MAHQVRSRIQSALIYEALTYNMLRSYKRKKRCSFNLSGRSASHAHNFGKISEKIFITLSSSPKQDNLIDLYTTLQILQDSSLYLHLVDIR